MKGRKYIEGILDLAIYQDAKPYKEHEDYDEAVIGFQLHTNQFVYSQSKCIELLMEKEKWTFDEAYEFFSFNIEGGSVGKVVWVNDTYFQFKE
jgi:hypothetical protein